MLLFFSDHGIWKLFLTVTNIFMLITCTFLTRLENDLQKVEMS